MNNFNDYNSYFFIGVAGSGMSALAQFLSAIGKKVTGSDRIFQSEKGKAIKQKLEKENIRCYLQGKSDINNSIDAVIVSTAIEETVFEYAEARRKNIPVFHRSDLLASIVNDYKTIAVAGTSGKSTCTAMIFHILNYWNKKPSLISGAGLVQLQKLGKIGNTFVNHSEYLVVEADESDGSLVKYKPEIGIILNIDKDHKTLSELVNIFTSFSDNVKKLLIVNQDQDRCRRLSKNSKFDFSTKDKNSIYGDNFNQNGYYIEFDVSNTLFKIPTIGKHNMENALAAISCCNFLGLSLKEISIALMSYKGIYRRHQIINQNNDIVLIDDYAHNPAKIASSIKACQKLGKRLIAWFQPHGFKPTIFMKDELIQVISTIMRDDDMFYLSDIFYAGGTVDKSISSKEIINELKNLKSNVFYCDKMKFPEIIKPKLVEGDVILLMGARDPALEKFAYYVDYKLF